MKRVHSAFGTGKLNMNGSCHLSGPQSVSEIPEDVAKIFDEKPEVQRIAICTERDGEESFVIYMRID